MLYGPRVTLRAMTPADYPRMTEFKNDAEVELLGGDQPRPRTLAAITEFFDKQALDKDSLNFAIEVDGTFIGDIGLFHVEQLSRTAEFGIGIGDRAYWSKGYGREAVALLVDYAFSMHNLRRIWLKTHATNERAIRSYLAVGFVEEGRQREHAWLHGQYVDLVMMGLMRSEWRPQFQTSLVPGQSHVSEQAAR